MNTTLQLNVVAIVEGHAPARNAIILVRYDSEMRHAAFPSPLLGTILIPPKILLTSNVGKFVASKTPQPGLPVGIAYDHDTSTCLASTFILYKLSRASTTKFKSCRE